MSTPNKDNQCITCGAIFFGSWTGECPTCEQKAIQRFVAQPQRSEHETLTGMILEKMPQRSDPEDPKDVLDRFAQRSEQQENDVVEVALRNICDYARILPEYENEIRKQINAALTAERQRTDRAMDEVRHLIKLNEERYGLLLSAQAAIGFTLESCHTHGPEAIVDCIRKLESVDLTALHEHDADVRKPLVDALEKIKHGEGLSALDMSGIASDALAKDGKVK